jgi:hypothetical protein
LKLRVANLISGVHTRSYVLSIGAERFSVFPIDFVWLATRSESEVEMEFPDVCNARVSFSDSEQIGANYFYRACRP